MQLVCHFGSCEKCSIYGGLNDRHGGEEGAGYDFSYSLAGKEDAGMGAARGLRRFDSEPGYTMYRGRASFLGPTICRHYSDFYAPTGIRHCTRLVFPICQDDWRSCRRAFRNSVETSRYLSAIRDIFNLRTYQRWFESGEVHPR